MPVGEVEERTSGAEACTAPICCPQKGPYPLLGHSQKGTTVPSGHLAWETPRLPKVAAHARRYEHKMHFSKEQNEKDVHCVHLSKEPDKDDNGANLPLSLSEYGREGNIQPQGLAARLGSDTYPGDGQRSHSLCHTPSKASSSSPSTLCFPSCTSTSSAKSCPESCQTQTMPFSKDKQLVSSRTLCSLANILKKVAKPGQKRSYSTEGPRREPNHNKFRQSVSVPAKAEDSSHTDRDIWSALFVENSPSHASTNTTIPQEESTISPASVGELDRKCVEENPKLSPHSSELSFSDRDLPPLVKDYPRNKTRLSSTSSSSSYTPSEAASSTSSEAADQDSASSTFSEAADLDSASFTFSEAADLDKTVDHDPDLCEPKEKSKSQRNLNFSSFLKKMEVALKNVTERKLEIPSPAPSVHHVGSIALMRSFIMDSDDELPDLEPENEPDSGSYEAKPMILLLQQPKPEPEYKPDINSLMNCTCAATAGRTKITCLRCRLSGGEPPPKKVKSDRHFMDSLLPLRSNSSTDEEEEEEENKEDDCETLDGISDQETVDSDSSLESLDSPPPQRRVVKITRPLCKSPEPITPARRRVRVSTQELDPLAEGRKIIHSNSRRPPCFPHYIHPKISNSEDRVLLIQPFSHAQSSIVKAIFEEQECDSMLFEAVKVISSYSSELCEAPEDVLQTLLEALINSKDERLSHTIYNFFQRNLSIHPPASVPFKWELVEKIMDNLKLPYGGKNVERVTALSNIFALYVVNSYIEAELFQRSLSSQQRVIRSGAYKWLCIEGNSHHFRKIISWISQAVNNSEYNICNAFNKLSVAPQTSQDDFYSVVPKVLPCLQWYLGIAMCISRSPEETAKRLSNELAQVVRCQRNIVQKELFLSTLTSPLLKLKLCQQILEDMLDIDEHGCLTLKDILYNFYRAEPLRTSLTHPLTPSDSEEEEFDRNVEKCGMRDADVPQRKESCSIETWEHVLLYLCVMTVSYVEVEKGALKTTLWSRELNGITNVDIGLKDRQTLKDLPNQINMLKQKILHQCQELSPLIQLYLMKLECLADVSSL